MDCIVLQENLHQALSTLLRTITNRSELPVLSNVLIETKEGKCYLSGTNLETGIRMAIGAKVEKEGAITVPAKLLAEFIATLSGDKIHLSMKETSLEVKTDTSRASFTTIPASEFPPFPEKSDTSFSFSKDDISLISSQVAYAASTDEGRPILTGIQVQSSENMLTVAATDGFRLSVRRIPVKNNAFPDSIIPAKSIQEIAKIATDKKAETILAYIAEKRNQIIFTTLDVELFSRLLEGEFPNYERIIPKEAKTKTVVQREDLSRAVRAAAIFARESANIVRLSLTGKTLSVSANTPQLGEEKSEVGVEGEGEDNEIAFNYKFLMDFLNSTPAESVVFEMTTPLSPALFHPSGDSSYVHIIMPVRVQG